MSAAFTKISRFSNSTENVIVIEMKIKRSDLENTQSIRSKNFYATDTDICYLELCAFARDASLALHLHNVSQKRENMLQRFFISLSNADGVFFHTKVGTPNLLNLSLGKNDLLAGFGIPNISLNYPIFINCHLETQNTEKSTNQEVDLQCLRKLSVDFKKILDQANETDITLEVEGVNIKAHKMILCARSPVFLRMFEHSTSETIKNVVHIEDIRSSVMQELVTFLYTGTKKNDHDFDNACDLYYAADKYEVLSLRDGCKSDLLTQLQVDNACQMLILACRHGDEYFKDEVMKFIKDNFKTIVNTESFREVIKRDPNVALLLMRLHVNAD